jgi:hypothetical protein
MRVICAMAIIAMLTGTAYGQIGGQNKPPGAPPPPPKTQQEIESERAAERAYQNSLSKIPDQGPTDPWGNVRSDSAPKAAAKAKQRTKATVN